MTAAGRDADVTAATYTDGIGAERCAHCQGLLRQGNEPMVYLRRKDAETCARLVALVCRTDRSPVGRRPRGLLARLEQAIGCRVPAR